jgi:hypothetical protein
LKHVTDSPAQTMALSKNENDSRDMQKMKELLVFSWIGVRHAEVHVACATDFRPYIGISANR